MLRWLPLRLGKVDFGPLVASALGVFIGNCSNAAELHKKYTVVADVVDDDEPLFIVRDA